MVTELRRLSIAVFVIALAAVVGCSKKQAAAPPAQDTSASTAAAQAPAPVVHQPAPAPPPTQPAAPVQDMDTQVNDRSIAYLRSLVARKDYARARQAVSMFNGRTLSPSQQQALDQLKAQIPPG